MKQKRRQIAPNQTSIDKLVHEVRRGTRPKVLAGVKGKPNLVVVVQKATGAYSFAFRWTDEGKMRQRGLAGQDFEAVEEQYQDLARAYKLGIDPAVHLANKAAEANEQARLREMEVAKAVTVGEVMDRHLKVHVAKVKRGDYVEYLVGRYILPKLGSIPLADVRARHVAACFNPIVAHKPTAPRNQNHALHNRVLKQWKSFCRWAMEEGYEVHPSALTRKALPENGRRSGVWSGEQLRLIAHKLPGMSDVVRRVLRFQAATAMRLGEVRSMTLDNLEVDWEANRGVYHLKPEHTKTSEGRDVQLSSLAVEVLREQIEPMKPKDKVWVGYRGVISHDAVAKSLRDLQPDIPEDQRVTPHGLRHTIRTWLSEVQHVGADVGEKILGYSRSRESQGWYDHATHVDRQREALELWADHLREVWTPESTDTTAPVISNPKMQASGGKVDTSREAELQEPRAGLNDFGQLLSRVTQAYGRANPNREMC